jgi:hypothetical protein
MRLLSKNVKLRTIENAIQSCFKEHPLETYLGQIGIDEVTNAVCEALLKVEPRARLTKGTIEDIYDAIRLYGPAGESDTKWLNTYGRHLVQWVDGRPEIKQIEEGAVT